MFLTKDVDLQDSNTTEGHFLVLDGTANLDYLDDDQIPRVKGLIELLNQFFDSRD